MQLVSSCVLSSLLLLLHVGGSSDAGDVVDKAGQEERDREGEGERERERSRGTERGRWRERDRRRDRLGAMAKRLTGCSPPHEPKEL